MNKNNIYISCAFLAGLGIGLVLGYVHERKAINDILNEEKPIDRSSDEPEEKRINKHLTQDSGNDISAYEEEDDEDYNSDNYETIQTRYIYNEGDDVVVGEDYPDDDEDEADEENDISEEEMDMLLKPANQADRARFNPYVIDAGEFGTDRRYEDRCLILYKNGVLTSEDGDVIDNEFVWVGDCLNKTMFLNNPDEDAIYIRNPRMSLDLEIYKNDNAYFDDSME